MTHVALLRGINVGRAKRVAMADLRRVMEELAFERVRTLLNSGNVVFAGSPGQIAGAAGRIERAVEESLGVSSRVTIVSAADLDRVLDDNPLADAAEPSRLLVAFPREPRALASLQSLKDRDWAPDSLGLGSRAAYLWCPAGAIDSPLAREVARLLGENVTMRNWATVLKLQRLVAAG